MHSYLSDKVKVVSASLDRRGVFAVRPIKAGEVIGVYGGHIITEKEYRRLRRTCFKTIVDYAIKVAEGFYLVSSKKGKLEDDDFFNHSCNPNAGIKGHLIMVAVRAIKPGEEVTYDYAMTDAGLQYAFRCRCGAAACRKVITSNDWKLPALQRRYKGYFSWFIEEKIRRQRNRRG